MSYKKGKTKEFFRIAYIGNFTHHERVIAWRYNAKKVGLYLGTVEDLVKVACAKISKKSLSIFKAVASTNGYINKIIWFRNSEFLNRNGYV